MKILIENKSRIKITGKSTPPLKIAIVKTFIYRFNGTKLNLVSIKIFSLFAYLNCDKHLITRKKIYYSKIFRGESLEEISHTFPKNCLFESCWERC